MLFPGLNWLASSSAIVIPTLARIIRSSSSPLLEPSWILPVTCFIDTAAATVMIQFVPTLPPTRSSETQIVCFHTLHNT